MSRTAPSLAAAKAARASRSVPLDSLRAGQAYRLRIDYGVSHALAMTGRKAGASPRMVEATVQLDSCTPGRLFGTASWRDGTRVICTPVELRNTRAGVECVTGRDGDYGGLVTGWWLGLVGDVRSAEKVD